MTRRYSPRKTKTLDELFWRRVDKSDDCWNWTGCKSALGYGQLRWKKKLWIASRVAYQISFGEINQGLCVCHKCDNPSCVRPDHLFLGTHKQNMDDMRNKKRSTWGAKSAHAKLTGEQITSIRGMLSASKGEWGLQTKIAKMFGVGQDHICRINSGQAWNQLE